MVKKTHKRILSLFKRVTFYSLLNIVLIIAIDLVLGQIYIKSGIRIPHNYYHHGFRALSEDNVTWNGKTFYDIYTNSLGFRDRGCRQIELFPDQYRILFIGDSHTEGVGLNYEHTFSGIIQEELEDQGFDVLNAAVVGYSPKLYYFKTKFLLEQIKLHFDKLIVCLDISDIQNELVYEDFEPEEYKRSVKDILRQYSFTYSKIVEINENRNRKNFYKKRSAAFENPRTDLYYSFFTNFSKDDLLMNEAFHEIGAWYMDRNLFESWGREGLILEKWHMTKLLELCRKYQVELCLTIHPWPIQIAAGDSNSIQVQFWQKFCLDNDIELVNMFPYFFEKVHGMNVIKEYYLPGDVHFNSKGHKLFAEELLKGLKK